jgi:hypothetical protein
MYLRMQYPPPRLNLITVWQRLTFQLRHKWLCCMHLSLPNNSHPCTFSSWHTFTTELPWNFTRMPNDREHSQWRKFINTSYARSDSTTSATACPEIVRALKYALYRGYINAQLKPNGNYMYHKLLTVNNSALYPQNIFVAFD